MHCKTCFAVTFCGGLVEQKDFFTSSTLEIIFSMTSPPCIKKTQSICRHNETIELMKEIPKELLVWKESQLIMNSQRVKRADVETPGKTEHTIASKNTSYRRRMLDSCNRSAVVDSLQVSQFVGIKSGT